MSLAMSESLLHDHVERELKYQARKEFSRRLRQHARNSEPMVGEITVLLGTVIAMAIFTAMLSGRGRSR
jgi:hypothetical protein